MKVAVTGASGLIGSALCPALESAGHEPVRMVRSARGGAGTIAWDPDAGRIDAAALEGVGAVVHLAGAGIGDRRWTSDRKKEILDSRMRGTKLLADTLAGLASKPAVLVSGSAVGYYGNRDDEELTEVSTPGDDFLAHVCKEWEAATAPAADAGIRVVNIRTGIVLARHGGVLKRLLTPFRLGLGGRLGSGKQYMSWITLDDEVGAIVHSIADDSLVGAANLTAPNAVTNAEFTATLGRVLHRPTAIPTPLLPLRAVYGSELVQHLLLDGQRVLPARLEATGYRFAHTELEPTLEAVLGRRAVLTRRRE